MSGIVTFLVWERVSPEGESVGKRTWFPVGAKVLLDGEVVVYVSGAWPEGTCFHPWPHYCVQEGRGATWAYTASKVGPERVGVTWKKEA